MLTFDTAPGRYQHWKLSFDGPVATVSMDVREDAGLSPDYKLKLNSYDLGVDIELADALQRIRFEHPEVHAVVVTSLKERIFCAGANIMMLRGSSHGAKVNFCKFTLAPCDDPRSIDRKSTRLNSSHPSISYAVFCLKKKKKRHNQKIVKKKQETITI